MSNRLLHELSDSPHPRALHHAHEEVCRLLTQSQPPAVAIRLQASFVEACLSHGQSGWVAYGIGVARRLALASARYSFLGWSPQELDSLQTLLRRCLEFDDPPVPAGRDWRLLASQAVAALARHRRHLDEWLSGNSLATDEDYEQAIASGAAGGGSAGREAQETGPLVEDAEEAESASVYVPVISRLAGQEPDVRSLSCGPAAQLLKLSVSAAHAPADRESPRIIVEGEMQPEAREAFHTALEAIRRHSAAGSAQWRDLLIVAKWNESGARLVGRSAGLGFALAALAAWNATAPGLRVRRVRRGLAATGSLQGSAVLPVDPETLALKAKACFFSPASCFFVSRDQVGKARAEIDQWSAQFPARKLSVEGLSEIGEAVHARGKMASQCAFKREQRPLRSIFARSHDWLLRSRIRMALGIAGLLLLIAISTAGMFLTANEPAMVEWEGGQVVVRNRHGWVTMRLPLRYAPELDQFSLRTVGVPSVTLMELNGDSHQEIVVAHCSEAERIDFLSAYDRNGREMWNLNSRALPIADSLPHENLRWYAFGPVVSSTDAGDDLMTIRRSAQSGLTYVERIDGESGSSLMCLRNRGHLNYLRLMDVDGDGTEDYVVHGTHSPRGILAVLETEDWADVGEEEQVGSAPAVIDIDDPRSLQAGVRFVLDFDRDRFTSADDVHCNSIQREMEGRIYLDVCGVAQECVQYRFAVPGAGPWQLLDVVFTDWYRTSMRGNPGIAASEEALAAEKRRLAGEVRVLRSDGWVPLAAMGMVDLAESDLSASRQGRGREQF
ncbi:MAG: hypothetical protein KBD56_08425 [Candidatus Eisenbacteria bacterium]|nr:hypothetical protein [Candidatus Eisenbacteria bacterium]